MKRERIIEIARKNLAFRKPVQEREVGYLFNHGKRVALLSLTIADKVDEACDVSRDILFAGAIFHDIAKGIEQHHRMGAKIVYVLLCDEFGDQDSSHAARLVAEHNQRNHEDALVSSKIIQDADVLDHFGAQGVWRMFHYNSAHDQPPEETLGYLESRERSAYVQKAEKSLNFEFFRKIFKQRLNFEKVFFVQFEAELNGRFEENDQ